MRAVEEEESEEEEIMKDLKIGRVKKPIKSRKEPKTDRGQGRRAWFSDGRRTKAKRPNSFWN